MSVREFTDAGGLEWRAWDIKPHEIHPATKTEDYLAECYITGWIAFETISGDQKRRLCPWPVRWFDETEEGLRRLLNMADIVPPHGAKAQHVSGQLAEPRSVSNDGAGKLDAPTSADLEVVRTFRYPGGRFWVVGVVQHPEDGGTPVLRFMAGARFIDLRKWHKDWADQSDESLISMLRVAAPRGASGQPDVGAPRRRWDDQPQAMA